MTYTFVFTDDGLCNTTVLDCEQRNLFKRVGLDVYKVRFRSRYYTNASSSSYAYKKIITEWEVDCNESDILMLRLKSTMNFEVHKT